MVAEVLCTAEEPSSSISTRHLSFQLDVEISMKSPGFDETSKPPGFDKTAKSPPGFDETSKSRFPQVIEFRYGLTVSFPDRSGCCRDVTFGGEKNLLSRRLGFLTQQIFHKLPVAGRFYRSHQDGSNNHYYHYKHKPNRASRSVRRCRRSSVGIAGATTGTRDTHGRATALRVIDVGNDDL